MTASTNFAGAATTKFDLDAAADTLAIIADWKRDLQQRIARRQLIFELATVGGEQDSLIAEVETFKRVCKAVAWPGRAA